MDLNIIRLEKKYKLKKYWWIYFLLMMSLYYTASKLARVPILDYLDIIQKSEKETETQISRGLIN